MENGCNIVCKSFQFFTLVPYSLTSEKFSKILKTSLMFDALFDLLLIYSKNGHKYCTI